MSVKNRQQAKRTWHKRLGLLLGFLVVFLGVSQWACSPARLDLSLYYPAGQDGKQVYDKIVRFRITMRGETLTAPSGDESSDFEPSENKGRVLPDVKCRSKEGGGETPKVEIEVIGIDGQDKYFASGRTVVFHKCGKPLSVPLFLSEVDAFATLTTFVSASDGPPATQVAVMDERRAGHRMARLPDGRLLITGGAVISGLGKIAEVSGTTEIYDPVSGSFSKGPSMSTPRAFHSITQVENSIVVVGGLNVVAGKLSSVRNVDVFSLNADGKLVRRDGPALAEGRAFHTATVIGTTSSLLIFGGMTWLPTNGQAAMAQQWEVIDYTQDEVVNKGPIDAANRRAWHSASRLEDTGRILIAGGVQLNPQGQTNTLDTMVSIQMVTQNGLPRAGLESLAEKLKAPRAAHTSTILRNKSVLLAGGMVARSDNLLIPQSVVGSMEIFAADGTPKGQINMAQPRVFHSTQRLDDGRVLLFGGLQSVNSNLVANTTTVAEIYSPDSADGIRPTPKQITQRKDRFMQSAVLLLNGSMIVIGGVAVPTAPTDPYATLNRGEIFNPGPK